MDMIKIVQHESPIPVNGNGAILRPFIDWDTSLTGAKWFSKPDETIFSTTYHIPLEMIHPNPWNALNDLGINAVVFKDLVRYKCPYTDYDFFWGIPIAIITPDVGIWTDRSKLPNWKKLRLEDKDQMRKFYPLLGRKGFRFSHIQRSLLGTGYTETCRLHDGESFLYDAMLFLDNGSFLASKVWMWFNKK